MKKPKPRLKPCPWCGKEPFLESDIDSYGRYFVLDCGHLRCRVAPRTRVYRTEATAVRHWNTRKAKR